MVNTKIAYMFYQNHASVSCAICIPVNTELTFILLKLATSIV